MKKFGVWQSTGLLLISLVWLGLSACAKPTVKKSEGQPCQLSEECEQSLECRNLVCSRGVSPEGGTEFPGSDDITPGEAIPAEPTTTPDEVTGDAGTSQDTQPDAFAPELIEPIISDSPPGELLGNTDESIPPESPGIPQGMFQRCTVPANCPSGLSCVDGFCLKSCYPYNDPIDCPEPARFVCTRKGLCTLFCKGANGSDSSLLCPVGMRCESGECVAGAPQPSGTKKEGEACKAGDCDGIKGLVCLTQIGKCVSVCDPRAGTANNSSCRATEECVDESRFSLQATSFLQGLCVPKASRKRDESCDFVNERCLPNLRCIQSGATRLCRAICSLDKGTSLNPTCTPREHCDGNGLAFPDGTCLPLPPKSTSGTGALGDRCQPGSCDSNNFLFCDTVDLVCVRVCRPKDGLNQNSLCANSQVCIEERSYSGIAAPRSFFGGRCASPATQNEGETCDLLEQRCRTGLQCFSGRCFKGCDVSKGTTANPDCAPNASSYCMDTQQGFAICRTVCEPRKGTATNSSCPVGQYCGCLDGQCCSSGQCPERVFCSYSALSTTGTRRTGETCSLTDPTLYCDGSRALYCRLGTCETSCDPRKGKIGNPNCTSTQECISGAGVTEGSPLQGLCVPKGTRLSGKGCDSKDRCADPLICQGGVCELPCDPNNGQVRNSTCAFTHFCKATFRGVSGSGVCTPLPKGRTGKRQEGERCTNSFAFPTKSCDESKGLTCDEGLGACVKACQPRDGATSNPKCGLNEVCVENINSFLGGLCAQPSALGVAERCNGTQWRCKTGLVCHEGLCHEPCDPTKGSLPTANCSNSSLRCVGLPGFDQQGKGVCLKICNPSEGASNNKLCGNTQVCEGFQGSRTSGLCQPTQQTPVGTQTDSQSCHAEDPDLRCAANLVCTTIFGSQICTPECDPIKARNACATAGRVCIPSRLSSNGAFCSTP